jgi:HSP20 family protein
MTNGSEKTVHTLVPAVDIRETKNSYVVTLDIPGAEKERIKAQIENNTLIVTASIEETAGAVRAADVVQEYRREFSLANDVDMHTVEAKYELGVLSITLNKKAQFLPKEITIN